MLKIPKGWKLVPEEPTREMELQALIAFVTYLSRYSRSDEELLVKHKDDREAVMAIQHMRMGAEMRNGSEMANVYKAMLKAAPPPLQIVK